MTNDSKTLTVVEFLKARLDEAERLARLEKQLADDFFGEVEFTVEYQWARMTKHTNGARGSSFSKGAPPPEAVLADIAAKRHIIADYKRLLFNDPLRRTDYFRGQREALGFVVQHLAEPYADHPDYQLGWAHD